MKRSNIRLPRGLFLILVLILGLGGLTPVRAAQFQNPIQAAKDAYKKAKEDAQRQKQQAQAPQAGQQATQPNPGQPTDSGTQPSAANGDCCSPEALKKIAASVGFVDIVGVKLGMTPAEVTAAIRAHKPALKIEVLKTRLFHPGSDQFVRVPRFISAQEPNGSNGYETISVEFTQPPSPPLASRIQRYVYLPPGQPVMASNLLESFRKKYGQDNFSQTNRAWIYDLNGKLPVSFPNLVHYCTFPGDELPLGTGGPEDYGQVNLSNTAPENAAAGGTIDWPDCVPYVVVTARGLTEDVAPNTPIQQLTTTLQSGALVYNSRQATYKWLKAEADAKAKAESDAAKARTGPKL